MVLKYDGTTQSMIRQASAISHHGYILDWSVTKDGEGEADASAEQDSE